MHVDSIEDLTPLVGTHLGYSPYRTITQSRSNSSPTPRATTSGFTRPPNARQPAPSVRRSPTAISRCHWCPSS